MAAAQRLPEACGRTRWRTSHICPMNLGQYANSGALLSQAAPPTAHPQLPAACGRSRWRMSSFGRASSCTPSPAAAASKQVNGFFQFTCLDSCCLFRIPQSHEQFEVGQQLHGGGLYRWRPPGSSRRACRFVSAIDPVFLSSIAVGFQAFGSSIPRAGIGVHSLTVLKRERLFRTLQAAPWSGRCGCTRAPLASWRFSTCSTTSPRPQWKA